jgi:hypothetical protein
MPTGVRIQNGADVRHFYTAADKNNANHVVFSGDLDSGANSPRFDLVADENGKGHLQVSQAGEIGVDIFEIVDNGVLVIKEQSDQ